MEVHIKFFHEIEVGSMLIGEPRHLANFWDKIDFTVGLWIFWHKEWLIAVAYLNIVLLAEVFLEGLGPILMLESVGDRLFEGDPKNFISMLTHLRVWCDDSHALAFLVDTLLFVTLIFEFIEVSQDRIFS